MAVLGGNELGKTSLLEAIEHTGHGDWDAPRELTDGRQVVGRTSTLSARYLLEEDDVRAVFEALERRPHQGAVKVGDQYIVSKDSDGQRSWQLHAADPPNSTHALQKDLAGFHDRLLAEEAWLALPGWSADPGHPEVLRERARQIQDSLRGEERLRPEQVDTLGSLLKGLRGWASETGDPSLLEWRDTAQRLRDEEAEADPPSTQAGRLLWTRLPKLLRFEGGHRSLPHYTKWNNDPSRALINLLDAGGTSFDELKSVAEQGDRRVTGDAERAVNLRLAELFRQWSQREISASILCDADGIEVQARDRRAPHPDVPIDRRSDGMRMFTALLAFVHARRGSEASRPVLLVDEAEAHLNYDAQADLVRTFDRQTAAQSVIYTTHSIGCLPEDLGLGIAVVREIGAERSAVSQSFWTDGIGLSPIVAHLGATIFAFTPARRVLIGEGAHEAILLPSLLREARGGDVHRPLGFQIVGGLSEVRRLQDASLLEEQAGTVLYVVDNDPGGMANLASVPQSARDDGRAFVLGEDTDVDSIEDLVDAGVFSRAIDAVFNASSKPSTEVQADDIPASGRAKWAEKLLARSDVKKARTRLAVACVDLAEGKLLEEARRPVVQRLLNAVTARLER